MGIRRRYVDELFADRAQAEPQRIAVDDGGDLLTYSQCYQRVCSVADRLARGLPKGARLGIVLPKGPDAIVVMLACARAGITYVPIDPTVPLPRQKLIATRSAIAAIAFTEATREAWCEDSHPGPQLILELTPGDLRGERDNNSPGCRSRPRSPGELACVLYTSGSTGEPKGVAITHAALAHFVNWAVRFFKISADDRLGVHAPLHFDLPLLDIYGGFAAGATVCPIDEKTVLFPSALRQVLADRKISILYAVPSAYVALVERGALGMDELELRLVLYAGEEFHVPSLARLMTLLPRARVFNLYGPMETNVVTAHEVVAANLEGHRVPIGRPIAGMSIYLCDEHAQAITTPGTPGELCVQGPQVSPGYWDGTRPKPVRRDVDTGARTVSCYPTGDWASWTPDGELAFLGRRDGMIKTRGYRVEIAEVEATLARHPCVAETAVFPTTDEAELTTLSAVAVAHAHDELTSDELLQWCRAVLPAYMVPAQIFVLERLRYTSTGKIDRQALRQVVGIASGSGPGGIG